jgi:putative CocE/NonD family hydrolase
MLRPPHLVAMFALVGGANFYDEYGYPGGVLNVGWPRWILNSAATSPQAARNPEAAGRIREMLADPKKWLALDAAARLNLFHDFPDHARMYEDMGAHPTPDDYWKQKGFYTAGYYGDMKDVPVLFITGWYDYFGTGAMENFAHLASSQHTMKRLIVGPWPHGTGQSECGDAAFSEQAALDQRALMADWFDHWTHGASFKLVSDMPVQYFRMGGGDGARLPDGKVNVNGQWQTALSWPPPPARVEQIRLRAAEYRYDPSNAVPSKGGRYMGCVQNQDIKRPDIISTLGEPLAKPLDVTGRIRATIWASSDAPSADFVIKLIDVFPNGYAMPVAGGIRRVEMRGGTPQQASVDLGFTSIHFGAGHRIRVDVASSDSPGFEPNPHPATVKIYSDAAHQSAVQLPVVSTADEFASYVVDQALVPMRDGVKLATDVYRPASNGAAVEGRFPVLVTRSPYNKNGERRRGVFFAKHGFVFVAQDTRGRYQSEGEPYPLITEGRDGYDAIEWAAVQPWSNGKVGTTGASYLAMDQYAAAIERPPHLEVMYAAVGGANYYYDSAYHGGIRELGWPVWLLLSAATDPHADAATRDRLNEMVKHPEPWLREPAAKRAEVFANFPAQRCAYDDFYAHPEYDAYWRQTGFDTSDHYAQMTDVPIFFLSGWYDSFADSTIQNFTALSRIQKTPKRMMIGPWPHGYGKPQCGDAWFGPTAELDENPLQLDWFNHWLKARPFELLGPDRVKYFRMGGQESERDALNRLTPGGEWITASSWPPAPEHIERVSLTPGEYQYDPRNPVHTTGGRNGPTCIVNETVNRPDVLTTVAEPLKTAMNITGKVRVTVWISADAPTADVVSKLIDVYSDGYAAPLLEGMQRAQTSGGAPQCVTVDLGTTSVRLLAGHRVRVDISSSSFPKLEPNPHPAHVVIHSDREHSSFIELPCVRR